MSKRKENDECGPGNKILNYVHSKLSKKAWTMAVSSVLRLFVCGVIFLANQLALSRAHQSTTYEQKRGTLQILLRMNIKDVSFILSYHHTTGRIEANFTNTKIRCFSCLYCKKHIRFIIDRSILNRLAKKNSLIEVRLP